MTALLLLAALTAQAPASPSAETEKPGVIRGTVVSATTKEPIRRADVTLQATMRPGSASGGAVAIMPGMMPSMTKAVTDAEGNFIFKDVKPGTYFLRAERSGYVPTSYGARSPGASPAQISVRPGQEVTGLRIAMTPQAVIAGRVLDEEGEPMQNVMVMAVSADAMQATPRRPGRLGMGMRSQGQTDDRGQFRLHNLPPGRYIIQVTPGRLGGMPVAIPSSESREEMGYVTTYYPGVTDVSQATRIEATPGAELSGFDIQLKRTRVYRLRGQVLDPSGEPAKNYFVNVMPKNMVFGPLMGQQFYPLPEGGFEVRNLVPGSYRIVVQANMRTREGLTFSDTFEMGAQDVEGLIVRLQPPVSLKGRVEQPAEQKLDLSAMRVMLRSDVPFFQRGGPPPVKDDGSFEIEDVPPGKYRVDLIMPAGGYIESIRYGDIDVTTGEFEVASSPAPLRVVVRPGGAAVQGVIRQDGKPASGIVYLIPSDPAKRTQLTVRFAMPDQNGEFSISNIRPGDYLLLALSEADWGIWDEPADFQAVESRTKKVSLKETSKESVELTIAK